MATINISLSDSSMSKLRELADKAGTLPELLLQRRIERLLTEPDAEFLKATEELLQKNAELYRRLA